MTAKEARESVRCGFHLRYNGLSHKIYNCFQNKIESAVSEGNLSCECRIPITTYYARADGQIFGSPSYPKIEEAMSLLREDGFNCRISQSGENWKVEIEW